MFALVYSAQSGCFHEGESAVLPRHRLFSVTERLRVRLIVRSLHCTLISSGGERGPPQPREGAPPLTRVSFAGLCRSFSSAVPLSKGPNMVDPGILNPLCSTWGSEEGGFPLKQAQCFTSQSGAACQAVRVPWRPAAFRPRRSAAVPFHWPRSSPVSCGLTPALFSSFATGAEFSTSKQNRVYFQEGKKTTNKNLQVTLS